MAADMEEMRRARVNADQQFHQLEKQLISCNSKLEREIKSNEQLKKELDDTSKVLEDKSQRLLEAETAKENAESNAARLSQLNENLEAEKLNFTATVERKNKEIDRLSGEWKSMFEKVTSANSLQYEAKAKLDELESKETSYQLREKRLEQEKELLKKQNEWFDSQLKEKSDAYFNLKKETSSTVQQLQSQLDAKIDEVKSLETLTESLRESNQELDGKVNSFMEKLRDARELQSKTEEQYKHEIASQNKLTILYKESAEESKQKCDELLGAVEELQSIVKETKTGCLEAESKLKESEENYSKTVKQYDEKVESLEHELRNANDLLEAARQRGAAPMSSESLAALSPTAAATSSFLRSGMTLTQIYNQYVDTLDLLQVEKAENTRVKEYMEDILKEIEEKAPLLQQQKKDYESALDTVDRLTEKLESAMAECERFSEEANEAVSKSEHLKRENDRMKILTEDLGNQVKVLLKECESARGGVISRDRLNTSNDEVSSSSEVISEHLVTFRNIEELQEQNQKLLTVVRELSEDKESQEEMNLSGSGHSELKGQLDLALTELEELKEARTRQTQMVDAVIRQRDMYRVLLSNTGQSPIAPHMLQERISASPISSTLKEQQQRSSDETAKALQELQKLFQSYKNERLANEKLLKETNDEMTSKLSEVNIENAKVSSQLEHVNERYKLLESSANSFKREADALRDKSQKLSVSLAKLETSFEASKQELSEVKEKLLKTEVMYDNMRQERNILKEAETRLMETNKSLLNQQKGQNSLVTNLQTIQNNLERQEYETRTRLTSQVEGLERELTVFKKKHNSDVDHHAKIVETFELQARESKQRLDTEMAGHEKVRKQLQNVNTDLEDLRQQFAEKDSHLSASETRLNEILTRNAEEDRDTAMSRMLKEQEERSTATIGELKEQLSETDSRNKVIESQLALAKQHLAQYKAMLRANEEALAQLNETSKLYKDKMEGEHTEAQALLTKLQEEVNNITKANGKLIDENLILKDKLAQETNSLRQSVFKLTTDLNRAQKRTEACTENEKRAKQICEEQKTLATEAQEKYEHELVNHATDVKALTEAKEQLQTFNERLKETEENWKSCLNELNECKKSWEEQKKIHEDEATKLVSRCGELVNQNSFLHQQGEKLSQQVLTAQSRSSSDVRVSVETSEDHESKTVQDLWEVIRYIRKEKEISETKSELLQSENMRNQQRLEYVERQLKDTETTMEKERQRSKMSAKDTKEHEEIMEKVARLGEIEEMNKILTSDKEALQKKINSIQATIRRHESEMGPLRENIRSLTSQKDMLVGEKTGLKNEIQRWKTRTNQLIEQCKQQADPEEFKKLQEEKKQLLAQQKTSKDESQKSKVQMDAMKNEITRLQAEIAIKKTETVKIQEELNSMKSENVSASSQLKEEFDKAQKDLEAKTEEVAEKLKTIAQLKKIARRYRTQYDEVVKEKEELNKKLAEERPAVEQTERENEIKTLSEEKKALEEEVEKLTQSFNASKEKEEKAKKTLNSCTKKIQQLMSLKDKYFSENEELKRSVEELRQERESVGAAAAEREMRLNVLSTQFEGKQSRMEKEIKDKNDQLEKYNQEKTKLLEREAAKESENDKLKRKVQQFQRLMLQAQQKAKAQLAQNIAPGSSTSAGASDTKELVTSQTSNVVPPTAAVKPTATPSTSVSVRPVSTPTASIRPMAMTTAAVQPTPTATVPPTVTTQPTAVAAVQSVAINEPITAPSAIMRTQSPSTSGHATVMPSVSGEVSSSPAVSVRPITSSNVPTIIAMATSSMEVNEERPADHVASSEERPASEVSGNQLVQEQSSVVDAPSWGTGNKRSRDPESSTEVAREERSKKARTETEEQSEVLEEDDILEGEGDEEDLGDTEEDVAEPEIVCIDVDSDDDDDVTKDDEREITDDDSVEVIDDDDDDDDDDLDMKDDFDDEAITEPDASTQEEVSEPVVRVVADSTPSTSNQARRSQEVVVVTSHTAPSTTQIRLVRSQSHLAPFTLSQAQPGSSGFDDTDDCMVPSTPTLFIPKRSDGFSEMISSPRVHHPSFSFGSSTEISLNQTGGLAMGMSEEGLRVDDTRFDIMVSSGEGEDPDLGFDNVVPDLDEAAAIAFPAEDEGGEPSGLSSMVSSTSAEQTSRSTVTADISEQNVPETIEKFDPIEPGELLIDDDDDVDDGDDEEDVDDEGTKEIMKDDEAPQEPELKLELVPEEGENDGDVILETRPSEDVASTGVSVEENSSSSAPEPSSTSRTLTQLSQEARPKPNVVQLRRPAVQTTTEAPQRLQTLGVQRARGRRLIRRVQGRGQPPPGVRGNQRRGRGGSWTGGQ